MQSISAMRRIEQGVLHIGGVSAVELAERYGTPLLVMDEAVIRDNIRKYVKSFQKYYHKFNIAYGAKAFLSKTMCRILADEGIGLDVVSGGELYVALQAGFPPEKIYFHGNNKLENELVVGLENEIGRFMVDNEQEAGMLNELAGRSGIKQRVILRVTPGIEAHTHEYIMTGQVDSKFGVGFAENRARNLIKTINNYQHLKLTGIHAHIGSQIFDLESFRHLIQILFEFMAELRDKDGILMEELDLGGGLGIAHINQETPPDLKEYVKIITEQVKKEADKRGYPLPEIIIEPGRSIIGPAGTTLYRVGTIKEVPGLRKYVAVDGGMTDNIRPSLYNAKYEAFLANRCSEVGRELVTIAGKCCESGDILVRDVKLPAAKRGDIVAIPATGAYTYTMSSNYNGLPRPAVVMVRNGKANLIIKRESYEDLIKNDMIPDGY